MTMIKKDGHWVTVAGGQRMWVGTKAQLDAALAAGELEDGTAVMVTDDYEEAQPLDYYIIPVSTSIPGITITKRDNNPKGLCAIRNGNAIILNFSLRVQGTFSSTSNWYDLFDWSDMLSHMLKSGETILDLSIPYFCTGMVNKDLNALDGVMNGRSIYMYPSTFDNDISGQIVITVSRA